MVLHLCYSENKKPEHEHMNELFRYKWCREFGLGWLGVIRLACGSDHSANLQGAVRWQTWNVYLNIGPLRLHPVILYPCWLLTLHSIYNNYLNIIIVLVIFIVFGSSNTCSLIAKYWHVVKFKWLTLIMNVRYPLLKREIKKCFKILISAFFIVNIPAFVFFNVSASVIFNVLTIVIFNVLLSVILNMLASVMINILTLCIT